MTFVEGTGAAREVAVCARPYNAAARARSKAYGGKFKDQFEVRNLTILNLSFVAQRRVFSSSLFKGGVRLNVNFICSNYCILDIDRPGYALAQAIRDWSDTVCIIGTTFSHQRPKLDADLSRFAGFPVEVVCDRFRIIAPWERSITSAAEYKQNIQRLINRYGADTTCVDPARLWFPCSSVEFLQYEGYLQPVVDEVVPEKLVSDAAALAQQRKTLAKGLMPRWVARFVHDGLSPRFSDGRQAACFDASRALRDRGWDKEDARKLLHSGKFDRTNFEPSEIDHAVDSAFNDERE
jgi:hypothetical protein